MTADLDKAIRAGCAQHTILRALDCNATKECEGLGCECGVAEVIAVALRSLAEPSESAIETMARASYEACGEDWSTIPEREKVEVRRGERAAHAAYIRHLLGEG